MSLVFEATDSLSLEDGVYDARLVKITEATAEGKEDQYARWEFLVTTAAYPDGVMLTATSSLRFGPKAKARKWLEAALGRQMGSGERVDPEKVLPLACRIIVKNDTESGYLRVTDVLKAPTAIQV
jgi:hypothetical protein